MEIGKEKTHFLTDYKSIHFYMYHFCACELIIRKFENIDNQQIAG